MFIYFLYMFQTTMCPSSGEITIYATLGICHSVWMIVWYAGWNEHSILHTVTYVVYSVTNTKCHIDTVIYPDDGQIAARNM